MTVETVRILADDLTGALDTASVFPFHVPVFIDTPAEEGAAYPVSVLGLPTRDVPPETLPHLLLPQVSWLQGATLSYKKVDSLLRGNTFHEILWLSNHSDFTDIIFAPAFPSQGRVTYDEAHWLLGRENPVCADLHNAFGACQQHHIHAPYIGAPKARLLFPEVRKDEDLDRIVESYTRHSRERGQKILWCGSAGLASALARQMDWSSRVDEMRPKEAHSGGRGVLMSASFQGVFKAQWAKLRKEIPINRAFEGCDWAPLLSEALNTEKHLWFSLSLPETLPTQEALDQVYLAIREIVNTVKRPDYLMVIGGDTLLGLCRMAKVSHLLAYPSPRNGWGCARLVGGCWDGLLCYTRSGAFGAENDLVEMLREIES